LSHQWWTTKKINANNMHNYVFISAFGNFHFFSLFFIFYFTCNVFFTYLQVHISPWKDWRVTNSHDYQLSSRNKINFIVRLIHNRSKVQNEHLTMMVSMLNRNHTLSLYLPFKSNMFKFQFFSARQRKREVLLMSCETSIFYLDKANKKRCFYKI